MHGLLLGYEKTAGIQAAKNLRRKKRLRPFPISARLGTAKSPALTELQFLEGPPPGGFSFCYVIGFPSNIREHRNGRSPESDVAIKKSVGRIGAQQARAHASSDSQTLRTRRIGPKDWPGARVNLNSAGVDKKSFRGG
jgi:hypothetical protein